MTGGGCLVPLLTIALLVVAACGAVASTPLPTDRPHRYGTMRVVDTLVRPSKGIGHQVVALLVRGDTGDDVQESFPLVYELQDTQACRAGNAYGRPVSSAG